MSATKLSRRILETLPDFIGMPKEKEKDINFLMAVLLYRREHMNCYRTDRRIKNREFNKRYNLPNSFRVLINHTKKKSNGVTKEAKRIMRADKSLIIEFVKLIESKFPKLMTMFSELKDRRQAGKCKYTMKTLCLVRLLALVCGIISMREINRQFNTEEAIRNIQILTGTDIESIPDWQTIQDVIYNMDIEEILNIRKYMVKRILESKMFNKFREKNLVQVLVDATGVASRDYNLNGNCISKKYKNSPTRYFKYALEAKIVFGDIVISIDTEWIENKDIKNEDDKQDCEINAFKRMAKRIKKNYPRLSILITGDALYAVAPVFEICEQYGWKYICNLKPKRLKKVFGAFNMGENYIKIDKYKAVKDINYQGHTFTVLSHNQTTKKGDVCFRYVTNIAVNDKNIASIVNAGRRRWKIENEGFNTQKNGEYNISHLCSLYENAIKIHYLFIQIAHLLRQLFELGSIVVENMAFETKKEISEFLRESLFKKIISDPSCLKQKIQLRFDIKSIPPL